MSEFWNLFASNSIRINPTFPLPKSQNSHNSLIESEFNIMYRQNIVANACIDASPRRRAFALGLRGVGGNAIVLGSFFNIITSRIANGDRIRGSVCPKKR
jgi:hypothetical protein